MRLTSNPRELACWLQADIDNGARLFSIDGFGGAGKTHLATQLANILNVPVTHLDNFLEPDRQNVLAYLDVDRFRATLDALREQPSIVEGVCIGAALTLASHLVSRTIYLIKQEGGHWTHGVHIPRSLSIEELAGQYSMDEAVALRMPSSKPRVFGVEDSVPLMTEIGIYHYDYRPDSTSDYGFLRDPVRRLG